MRSVDARRRSWLLVALLVSIVALTGASGVVAHVETDHLLFTSNRTGAWRLYAINPDGSGLSDVGPPASVLSPDGRVLLVDDRAAMVREGADGRGRRRIGSGRALGISPDGRRVAFLDLDDNDNTLVGVVGIDGTHRRILIRASADEYFVGWLPDSASFVLRQMKDSAAGTPIEGLLVASVQPGAPVVRTVFSGSSDSPTVSSRGLVAFTRYGASGQQLVVLDPARSNATSIVARAYSLGTAAWSPDGRWLAFVEQKTPRSTHALVIASANRRATLLTGQVFGLAERPWSPRSTELAVQVGARLLVIGVDGRVRGRAAAKNASDVRWSPDGSLVAFGSGELFIVNRDGTTLRRLRAGGSSELFGWARGPVPAGTPHAPALPAEEKVAGRTLRTRGRVMELAADGSWVAAIVGQTRRDCDHVVAWRAGATGAVRFGDPRPCDGNEEAIGLALIHTTITWTSYSCGNDCYRTPQSSHTDRPGVVTTGQTSSESNTVPAPTRPPPPAETHRGLAFSMQHGVIRLHRATDGREITIRPPGDAVDAELEDAGLFYAYNLASGPFRGRVSFIPFEDLSHRF
jgi:dipeptidyl aminopeptidase/acylaminoacyl peptidase